MEDGYFHIKLSTKVRICIHSKFYKFLGFSSLDPVVKVFWYHGNKYFAIEDGRRQEFMTITANEKFDIHLFAPELVQIMCHNIVPNLTGYTPNYIVESFHLDQNKKVVSHNPRSVKPFKVNTDVMTTVLFTLMDENNLPITFSPGVHTIIKLNIFEMNNFARKFYVKTSNYDSRDIFNSNKCFSFVTRLPKQMVLDNTWKVGLTSIFLPKNIYNIYKPMNTIIIEDDTLLKGQNSTTCELTPGYYYSSISLCSLINNDCLYSMRLSLRVGENGHFLLSSMDDRIVRRKIKIHKKLAGILGIPENFLIKDFSDHISFNFNHLEEKNNTTIWVVKSLDQ